jgi:hypothetical protein
MLRQPVFLFLACLATAVSSQCLADGYPLFNSDDTLELVLEVPMRELLRRAKKKPVLEGQLKYVAADGSDAVIDITITTRGKSRLAQCTFPPLSITLDEEQVKSTLFAGQRTIKIVTHCRNASKYQRYLLQEYGIYKAYNLLSDQSFRVRMLNVTYRDNQQKRRDGVESAFFIESHDEVADRLGMSKIKTKTIASNQFDVAETNKYELFQYMIGNTDWAIKKGPGAENCCHNGKVIGHAGSENDWVVLPYDFDQSGIINTEYALPSLDFHIRSVRQRLYRGRCAHNQQLGETIALINDNRRDIEAALAPQELSKRDQKKALKYLEVFYDTINDPKKTDGRIIGRCRGA